MELFGVIAIFTGLMLLGKAAIMGLDDRRSLMLRPIHVEERANRC